MSVLLDDDSLAWHQIDRSRFDYESRQLKAPWRLQQEPDGRYAWRGGMIQKRYRGKATASRSVRLIYPAGYPARFIEARLEPEIPSEQWGLLGVHVNSDGSACYINADGWSPQDDVRTALALLANWWWNYHWVVELSAVDTWPDDGLADV
jgi:hypothetical protein